MASALVCSVDNSAMTSYRRTGGLTTQDIAGARPRVLHRDIRATKPEWREPLNRPRRLHPPHMHTDSERPVLNLTNRDIEGSMTHGNFVSSRCTNPLQPDYPLPSHEHRPYTPPTRAVRDLALNTTDIEGAAPGPARRSATRDHIGVGDIEGTSSSWKPANTRYFAHSSSQAQANTRREEPLQNTNQLYVQDINNGQFRRKGTDAWRGRETNPLVPRYVYDVENRERWPSRAVGGVEGGEEGGAQAAAAPTAATTVIGPIAKSFPRPNRTLRVDPEYNLMTSDVDGATSGWRPPNRARKDWTRTNYIGDILGSSSTHPKPRDRYLVSRRHIDPVDPNYDDAIRTRTPVRRGSATSGTRRPSSLAGSEVGSASRHPILNRGGGSSGPGGSAGGSAARAHQAAAPAAAAAAEAAAPTAPAAQSVAAAAPSSPAAAAAAAARPSSGASSARIQRSVPQRAALMPPFFSARGGGHTGGGSNYGARGDLISHPAHSHGRRTPGGHAMSRTYRARKNVW